ncbi:putative 2OG-Fe(II) oxygenase [Nocardia asteroides]|uniref:putative 2OG-Fe(II) oxygenase n=1 Tax=Nocardia asteroides TaxID=1824 RepID=UPI0037C986FC
MTITQDTHVLSMWSTPLYRQDLGALHGHQQVTQFNTELRDLILEREALHRNPLKFGVIGATKTSLDILRLDTPAIDWLRQRVLDAVETISLGLVGDIQTEAEVDLVAEGWAVVYRSGASHRLHTHHESAWSGVYYIDVGGVGEGAGHLQLLDPRPGAIARQASTGVEYVQPRPGLMVVFPSWLPHSVKATLFGGATRICIAFNVGYQERISDDN